MRNLFSFKEFRRTGILKLKQIYNNRNLKIIDVVKVATPA